MAKANMGAKLHGRFWGLILTPMLLGAAATPPVLQPPVPQPQEQRTVMLTGYERVRVDGPYQVNILDGRPPSAQITGPRRAIEGVSIRNIGGQLVIAPQRGGYEGWDPKQGPVIITLGARDLTGVAINGTGSVTIDRMAAQSAMLSINGAGALNITQLRADSLALNLSGTGVVRIAGGTSNLARITTLGAGNIEARGLSVSNLRVNAQSSGSAQFTARYTADVISNGTGTINIHGPAACTLSGAGATYCAGKSQRR